MEGGLTLIPAGIPEQINQPCYSKEDEIKTYRQLQTKRLRVR
jgi:hypothetical protein